MFFDILKQWLSKAEIFSKKKISCLQADSGEKFICIILKIFY